MLVVVAVLLLPMVLMVVEFAIYQPLKFSWLIHRVEVATTPVAEREAFLAADRWGMV
jgi:hypothetical protein